MRRFLQLAAVLFLVCSAALGQSTPALNASQITFPVLTTLSQPSGAIALVGNPGPQTYYYWLVANYPLGSLAPVLVGSLPFSPAVLSSANYNQIVPAYPTGVTSLDLLRTTTAIPPSGACACAVAQTVTSGVINDQSNSLSAYTVQPQVNVNSFAATLTNEVVSPGTVHLLYRQNGNLISDLAIGGSAGSGNVVGPGTSTSGHIALFNNGTGTLLQDAGFGFPLPNAHLQNSTITITAGTGLTGGGAVSLGGSTSLGITNPAAISITGNAATATQASVAPSLCPSGQASQGVLQNFNAGGCFTPTGSGTVNTPGAQYELAIYNSVTNAVFGSPNVLFTPGSPGTLSVNGNVSANLFTGVGSYLATSTLPSSSLTPSSSGAAGFGVGTDGNWYVSQGNNSSTTSGVYDEIATAANIGLAALTAGQDIAAQVNGSVNAFVSSGPEYDTTQLGPAGGTGIAAHLAYCNTINPYGICNAKNEPAQTTLAAISITNPLTIYWPPVEITLGTGFGITTANNVLSDCFGGPHSCILNEAAYGGANAWSVGGYNVIRNIYVLGGRCGVVVCNATAGSSPNTENSFNLTNGYDILDNVLVQYSGASAVLVGSRYNRIINSEFDSTDSNAIEINSGSGQSASGNFVVNNLFQDDNIAHTAGTINISNSSGTGLVDGNIIANNQVLFLVYGTTPCTNVLTNAATGCKEGIQSQPNTSHTGIIGNFVQNTENEGIVIGPGGTVVGNRCDGCGLIGAGAGGILFSSLLSTSASVGDVAIVGNEISNCNTAATGYGISIQDANTNAVSTTYENITVGLNSVTGACPTTGSTGGGIGTAYRFNYSGSDTLTLKNDWFIGNMAGDQITTPYAATTAGVTGVFRLAMNGFNTTTDTAPVFGHAVCFDSNLQPQADCGSAPVSTPLAIANGGTNATSAAQGTVPNATTTTASGWTSTVTLGQAGTLTGSLNLCTLGGSGCTKITSASGSNNASLTVPNVTGDTFTLDAASQTLSNKTLTAPVINTSVTLSANLWESLTVPTVSSGFGSGAAIGNANGTAAFTLNVGTGTVTNPGVIGLPTASHGWAVHCDDITTQSANVFVTKQTASSATSATIEQFTTAGLTTTPWTASDVLVCTAAAY